MVFRLEEAAAKGGCTLNSMLGLGAGDAGGGCCSVVGGAPGRAQLISAVTDIVGFSFFAKLAIALHQHPHITTNTLHTHYTFSWNLQNTFSSHNSPR